MNRVRKVGIAWKIYLQEKDLEVKTLQHVFESVKSATNTTERRGA
jgi:hypothetical protein